MDVLVTNKYLLVELWPLMNFFLQLKAEYGDLSGNLSSEEVVNTVNNLKFRTSFFLLSNKMLDIRAGIF